MVSMVVNDDRTVTAQALWPMLQNFVIEGVKQ